MKHFFIATAALLLAAGLAYSQEPAPYPQLTNIGARTTYSLDGEWNTLVDLYEEGA